MEPENSKGLHNLPHADSAQNLLTISSSYTQYPSVTNLNMQTMESTNHTLSQLSMSPTQDSSSSFFNCFLSNSLIQFPLNLFPPNTSSLATNCVFNGQKDDQPDISIENRLKRIASNRESARRSRMRKKRQILELQFQVSQLQNINRQLTEKVIHTLESNHHLLQENSQLQERVCSLQVVLSDLLTPVRNVEESTTNANWFRGESSN